MFYPKRLAERSEARRRFDRALKEGAPDLQELGEQYAELLRESINHAHTEHLGAPEANLQPVNHTLSESEAIGAAREDAAQQTDHAKQELERVSRILADHN